MLNYSFALRDMAQGGDERFSNVRIRVAGALLFSDHLYSMAMKDIVWAVGSVSFVICFIWYHLKSFFMAMLAMLSVVLSFPVTYFIYTGIC